MRAPLPALGAFPTEDQSIVIAVMAGQAAGATSMASSLEVRRSSARRPPLRNGRHRVGKYSLPDALRLPLDGQRGIEVERRRVGEPEHHDAALVWCRDQSVVAPPGEWPAPLLPSEVSVERRSVGLEASDLVVADVLREALHGRAAVALVLARRQSRDRVDERGAQDWESFGLDTARRDNCVADECVAVVRDEMARA